MTVATGKRHITPSLVDVSSSAERPIDIIVTDGRSKPVSSHITHASTSTIYTDDVAANDKHAASVRHVFIHGGL